MAKELTREAREDGAERGRRGDIDGTVADDGVGSIAASALDQASEALHGLRGAIDQASHSLRELSQAGGHWARDAEERAIAIGRDLRGRGERAVGGVARQVERNPMASLGVAFALGFLCAAVVRR